MINYYHNMVYLSNIPLLIILLTQNSYFLLLDSSTYLIIKLSTQNQNTVISFIFLIQLKMATRKIKFLPDELRIWTMTSKKSRYVTVTKLIPFKFDVGSD